MGWTYTFAAVRPKNTLQVVGRAYFDRVVSSLQLADGEEFDLTISQHEEKRSQRANRFLWGVVYDELMEAILSAEGYRRDEWPQMKLLMHEGLCARYQGYVTDPVTKQQVRKFRSSKASKAEFTAYIQWLAQMVAEDYGVAIALPGESD